MQYKDEKKMMLISEEEKLQALIERYKKMPLREVAAGIKYFGVDFQLAILHYFLVEEQAEILAAFDISRQLIFFQNISKKKFAAIFEHMPSEDRTDLYQHMSQHEQAALLPFLSKSTQANVMALSAYPPETAGGIMNTDFATILANMTAESAITKVRRDAPSKKMIYYIYVVDHKMKLLGFVTLKDLILARPDQLVGKMIHRNIVSVYVDEDREEVARKVEKYDLFAIPVINYEGQLVGIAKFDEVLEVIRAEQTEDMEKFMGIMPAQQAMNYIDASSWQHFRKRVIWIVSLAAVGIISGIIIHHFEGTLEALIILALYMPMVADTGGNSGSQAATVIVRALALGHVSPKQWLSVLVKEMKISLLLAICLGLLTFVKVLFLSWETEIPAYHNLFNIAWVIALALSLQVITATCIGASLPLIVKRFGGDPAVVASPAITTIVDITGLLIYFGCAVLFMGL